MHKLSAILKHLGLALGLLALCACAVKYVKSDLATRVYTPVGGKELINHAPPLNTDASVEIGQSMISTTKSLVFEAIDLEVPVAQKGTNLGHPFSFVVPAEVLVCRGSDSTGKYYQAKNKLQFHTGGGVVEVEGGVYVPMDSAKATEVYWLAPGSLDPLNCPHPGIQFKRTTYKEWGEQSFKRELVYTGKSGNTISILYREYMNDMARPAFTQQLSYDLSDGNTIGFKDARFEVIKATNTGIEYRVLKNLT